MNDDLKITAQDLAGKGVSSLRTAPNRGNTFGTNGLSAEDLKKRFDELPKLIAERFNALLRSLEDGTLELGEGAPYETLAALFEAAESQKDFFELLAYDYLSRAFAWGGAFATGYGAVAFGGRRYDDAENPERHASEANGPQSFAANAGNRANGPWGSAFGKETESHGGGSHSRGGGTEAGVSYEFFLKFFSLEDSEESLSLYKEALVRSNTTLHTTADKAGYKYWFADASGEAAKAYARASCAKNLWTEAWGDGSSAEGAFTKSLGYAAHSEGGRYYMNGTEEDVADDTKRTIARGDYSHAENKWTHADGEASHSEGWGTIAKAAFQHVQGRFNEIDLEGRYVHIVGWGYNDSDRRNIHTIDRYGNAVFSGEVHSKEGLLASRNYVDHGLSEKAPSDSVERLAKRVTNLEAGIGPDYQVTDSETAYVKAVPDGALPYAEIEAIGGMTYKEDSPNLFNLDALKNDTGSKGLLTVTADGIILAANPDYMDPSEETTVLFRDICPKCEVGKTYTLSYKEQYNGAAGMCDGGLTFTIFGTYPYTFTVTEEMLSTPLMLRAGESDGGAGFYSCGGTFTNIMLNEGAEAKPFVPKWQGTLHDTPVTAIESVGKNLFDEKAVTGAESPAGVNLITAVAFTEEYIQAKMGVYGDSVLLNPFVIYLESGQHVLVGTDCYIPTGGAPILQVRLGLGRPKQGTASCVFGYRNISAYDAWERVYAILTVKESGWYYISLQGSGNASQYSNMDVRFKNITVTTDTTATEHIPFTKHTFPVPPEVQAIDGYDWGIPNSAHNGIEYDENGKSTFAKRVEKVVCDGTESWYSMLEGDNRYYILLNRPIRPNSNCLSNFYPHRSFSEGIPCIYANATQIIVFPSGELGERSSTLDDWKAHLAAQYAAGKPLEICYELAEPVVTDISHLITPDNFIEVEGGGIITAVNEHSAAVPTTIHYRLAHA